MNAALMVHEQRRSSGDARGNGLTTFTGTSCTSRIDERVTAIQDAVSTVGRPDMIATGVLRILLGAVRSPWMFFPLDKLLLRGIPMLESLDHGFISSSRSTASGCLAVLLFYAYFSQPLFVNRI